MRNSSLVKRSCAENVTGLKLGTEATGSDHKVALVGERSACVEVVPKGAVERAEVRMPV